MGAPFASLLRISASLAVMIPVPEPSSRTVKVFGRSPTSRSGSVHGFDSDKLGKSFLDENQRPRRAGKGLGGSNSIEGSADSKYAVRVYAASLCHPDDEFKFKVAL